MAACQASGERRVVGVVRGGRYFGPEQDAGAEICLPVAQCQDGVFLVEEVGPAPPLVALAPSTAALLHRR